MTLLGQAGFALAAALFAALAGWQLVRPRGVIERLLVLGFVATALWALAGAIEGPLALTTQIAGSGRNFAWLGVMLALLFAARTERATRGPLMLVYAALFGVLAGQTLLDLLPGWLGPRAAAACTFVALLLRMVIAVGALVLVHNLYTAAAREARWALRLPMAALAVMWTFDLNGYALAYLLGHWPFAIFAARGWVVAGTAPLFAVALWRNAGFRMRLSRAATFQSLSLLAILFYLGLMLVAARAAQILGGDGGWLGIATLLLAAAVAGVALLVPRRVRAWTRVTLVKHLFQHRYDYRAEWLRFTETLGRGGAGEAALEPRVVKAFADIVEAPGGLLLLRQEDGALAPGARWSWPALAPPPHAADAALVRHLEATGRIVELDELRSGRETLPGEAALMPAWLIAERAAWVAVPLVHFGRLVGVVLLARPLATRALDWEDFDLLRAAGRQGASYLAEARGQAALGEAQRFDEFNRRFAFIIHDIKNLVSQLSLVARNAERHADNPAFRADMIATLQESVGRMNDLLARLSQHNGARAAEPRAIALKALADALAADRGGQHPVRVEGADDVLALADPVRLEQALGHLLQNAIDASARAAPVRLRVARTAAHATIDVIDQGTGMTPDFVATRLFTPFASTKAGGFGIGAFEARALVQAMGGRLEIESAAGAGSRFRLLLPLAADLTAGLRQAPPPSYVPVRPEEGPSQVEDPARRSRARTDERAGNISRPLRRIA